eukprot:TRINITY_DN67091_c5_g5_i1.p1 TRINITY_DN67091_c5_g5~~TRINITY_DN67091_c5_g5_i1.p1  ORF type:complete len:398 (+),score=139.89 TRINITY_DN67091_c5_g5_i1:171-1196(+)
MDTTRRRRNKAQAAMAAEAGTHPELVEHNAELAYLRAMMQKNKPAGASPASTHEWEDNHNVPITERELALIETSLHESHMAKQGVTYGKGCSGLAPMCAPCFMAPGSPICTAWEETCKRLFCLPLCLRFGIDVKVKAAGGDPKFMKELSQKGRQRAIQEQLKAVGCADVMGCCDRDENLNDWVEERTYRGYFTHPMLPLPSCDANTPKVRAKKCAMCKSAVVVVAKPKPIKNCDYFKWHIYPMKGAITQVFARAEVPAPTQIPKHKAFKERCLKMNAKVAAKVKPLIAKMQAVVCECLGCCAGPKGKPGCFPVAYNDVPQALSEAPSLFEQQALAHQHTTT